MVWLVAVEFEAGIDDGFADGDNKAFELVELVDVEGGFVCLDVFQNAPQTGAQDGKLVGDVELFWHI